MKSNRFHVFVDNVIDKIKWFYSEILKEFIGIIVAGLLWEVSLIVVTVQLFTLPD